MDGSVKESKMAHSLTKKRKLDTIMKLDMVNDLKAEDVKLIWVSYLSEKARLADALSVKPQKAFKYNNTITLDK